MATMERTGICQHCREEVTYDGQGNWRSIDTDPICFDGDSGPVWHSPMRPEDDPCPICSAAPGELCLSDVPHPSDGRDS